jgi:hypothetical protein
MKLVRDQWVTSQAPESAKDSPIWSTVKVSLVTDSTIILSGCIIQHDSCPLTGSKQGLADVCNVTGANSIDPDSITDDETVRVQGQDVTA